MNQKTIRPSFWQHYPLSQLTKAEWEALCDGCGACCLVKLEDEETGAVEYTDVACRLLNCETGQCSRYAERQYFVPDCINLTPEMLPVLTWLPASCAYKRLYQGKNLPDWHVLITQNQALSKRLMSEQNISVAGRCVSESVVDELEQEERIIHWILQ